MIEVVELSKRFDQRTAVDRLSFSVESGQVLGFLGPNGAGKSTTMKMLTGFLQPTSGTARIAGHDIQDEPLAVKKGMGYLPEGAPAYGDMSVAQFLQFIADIRELKGTERRKRLDAVTDQVHLGRVLDQRIETLSKGFRRRVGLAQAILHDPKILILDEPTDGLDPNQKHEVRNLIQSMSRDKTIIVSTHILEEVEAVCTRAMIIAEGRLLADGTPEELARRSRYHGALTLKVTESEAAARAIGDLPEVDAIERAEEAITIFPKQPKGLLDAVNGLIEQYHWEVQALYHEKGRLDEVFRNITGGAEA